MCLGADFGSYPLSLSGCTKIVDSTTKKISLAVFDSQDIKYFRSSVGFVSGTTLM
jgi:hypothetical protein